MGGEVRLVKDLAKLPFEIIGGAIETGAALTSDAVQPGARGFLETFTDAPGVLKRDALVQAQKRNPEMWAGINKTLESGDKQGAVEALGTMMQFIPRAQQQGEDVSIYQPFIQRLSGLAGFRADPNAPGGPTQIGRAEIGTAGDDPEAQARALRSAQVAGEGERRIQTLPGEVRQTELTNQQTEQNIKQDAEMFPVDKRSKEAYAGQAEFYTEKGRTMMPFDVQAEHDARRERHLERKQRQLDLKQTRKETEFIGKARPKAEGGDGLEQLQAEVARYDAEQGRGGEAEAPDRSPEDELAYLTSLSDPSDVLSEEMQSRLMADTGEVGYSEIEADLKAHGIKSPRAISEAIKRISEALQQRASNAGTPRR